MSLADAFVGVDSGPMHVARAFGVPSLVFLREPHGMDFQTLFKTRAETPHYLRQNRKYLFLYSENVHIAVDQNEPYPLSEIDSFFSARSAHFPNDPGADKIELGK